MKLAISQIAWEEFEDQAVAQILHESQVKYVETTPARLKSSAQLWEDHSIEVVAMQALLFGQPAWSIFTEEKKLVLSHLKKVFQEAQPYGVKNYVFGSPKNRSIPEMMKKNEADDLAMKFFTELGDIASRYDAFVCLEPVPEMYGCNFLTTTEQTLSFLKNLAHPHVRLNLDLGAMQVNQESPSKVIPLAQDFIQHLHISEPHLLPIRKENTFHHEVVKELVKIQYSHVCSIEMKKSSDDPNQNLQTLREVLESIQEIYAT